MAAFLPVAVLVSLLVTGATASGYGSPTTPSSSTPASYTPTPATPPPPPPTATPPAPYTPSKPAHDYDDDGKKLLEVVVRVRVEGVVLCQSCASRGSQGLDGAALLPKAQVMVTCRDRKDRVMAYRRVVADSNGYFHAEFGVQRADYFWSKEPREACFVRLLASPDPECNVLTNIHGGIEGAALRYEGKHWIDGRGFKNIVHAAGPLAFRPEECEPTHRY